MEAFYMKQKTTYLNGEKTPFLFVRLKSDGSITTVSKAKRRISKPKTFSFQSGFVVITKDEFEKEMNEILNQL